MEVNKKVINPFNCYLNNNVISIINSINEFNKINFDLEQIYNTYRLYEIELNNKIILKELDDLKLQLDYIQLNIENLKKAFHYYHIETVEKLNCNQAVFLINLN